MTTQRLSQIEDVRGPATLPGYDPAKCGVGIVHLGIGAFHRAHQAVMTDDALAHDGGDWRIIGVSLRSAATADAMNPQNGLYTLIERDRAGTSARIIASIDRVIAADPAATLQALCDPAIRVVTLTVTEKGYGIDRRTHAPDPAHQAVAADIATPDAPVGVLGLLVAAIKQRRAAGSLPFSVLSCDNLPENGALLRSGVVGFARLAGDADLADWIASTIAFPSSMVDRITPAATGETRAEATRQTGCEDRAAIETEPFSQWVIEDNFPSGRPNWGAGGALFVSDVSPYEQMKLTMLNGSHSMLAYAGFLTGQRYVRDVMSDPDLAALVGRHLAAAAGLLRPLPGIDFAIYTGALTERFRNPAIAHQTAQIAMDGTQKLPQRIFQPALNAMDSGQNMRPFAFAAAMWMRYCMGRHDDGSAYDVQDPRSSELAAALSGITQSAAEISEAFHQIPDLISLQLSASSDWRTDVNDVLSAALEHGCLSAVQQEARHLNSANANKIEPEKGLLRSTCC